MNGLGVSEWQRDMSSRWTCSLSNFAKKYVIEICSTYGTVWNSKSARFHDTRSEYDMTFNLNSDDGLRVQ